MLETLDAAAVRRWCAAGLAALRRHEQEINDLNVYPVPDGDTGTNLVLTLAAAQRALREASSEQVGAHVGSALQVMARGALVGARGNSGLILAEVLRGLADTLAAAPVARGRYLADGLTAAAKEGYAAVAEPVEGTILSVVTAAARAADGADSDHLPTVTLVAADAAAAALTRTVEQLPVLTEAGVVDAGGRGLVVLLDALVEVVAGKAPARPAERPALRMVREMGSAEYAYEVQYLLDADEAAVAGLRTRLAGLGDSLVVVGAGDGTWKVHVHVNDVGAALEAGVAAGRPHQISVTRLLEPATAVGERGVVVAVTGDGLVSLFAGEGARVIAGDPDAAELCTAIRATGAGQVVVLVDGAKARSAAAAAVAEAEAEGVRAAVVPISSPVQALAALAVRDSGRRFEDDVIAMAEAAGACRHAQICHVTRDALTVAGRCRAGDVLGLVEGEVHVIGEDVTEVGRELLDRLLGGGGELVTLVTGAEAPAHLADRLSAHLASRWPFVEVRIHHGGQPTHLLLGVE